jgi:hypothetical protein
LEKLSDVSVSYQTLITESSLTDYCMLLEDEEDSCLNWIVIWKESVSSGYSLRAKEKDEEKYVVFAAGCLEELPSHFWSLEILCSVKR